jgi:hypothetical protein
MAGDWMKVEKVTPDKPEIEAIAGILDIDPDAVFGKCFRIWKWFDDHTTDGNAPSVTKNAIDRRAGVAGFADAMEKAGWLVTNGEGVSLPRFERHNGETAKARALTSKRVAAHKGKGNAKANAEVTQEVTRDALPREEKRREEIKNPLPPLPPTLDVPKVVPLWESFVAHRREIRKPLKERSAAAILAKLERWGPDKAATALENSIGNGWQGVFEPDEGAVASNGRRAPRGPELDPNKAQEWRP